MKYKDFKDKTNFDEEDIQRTVSIVSILVGTVVGAVGLQLGIKLIASLLNQFAHSKAIIPVTLVTSFIGFTYIIIQRDKKYTPPKVNDWKDLFYKEEE